MYLAIERAREGLKFLIRRSVKNDNGVWISQDLFDLGPDPEDFVEYIDERVFLISGEVEDALFEKGVEYDYEELEEIFWPFIDPDIKQTIEDFGGIRGRGVTRKRRYSRQELERMQASIHPFDRRRMLFLKLLQVNLEPLMNEPLIFLNRLLDKSRDELEHAFEFMEMELRPYEMRSYLYAIFGLPERFGMRLSRFIPEVQDQELMDGFFIEEVCRLNSDGKYLDEGARPLTFSGLHPYLMRYVIEYFDFAFKGPGPGRVEGSTGPWHPPPSSVQEGHLKVMGLSRKEFEEMSEKEFVSFFRKKAQRLHPDKGGEHESFIRLKEAFESLLVQKRW